MKCPLYSIITVCLNNEYGIAKTSESIRRQICVDFEWIVIDGGSNDNSVDFAKDNPKLTCLVSESDDGIYHAMNKGIALARGDYCLFLNSGDWLYADDVLENVAKLLKKDIIVGWLNVIYPERFGKSPKMRRLDLQDVRKKFLYHRTLHHQATFIRRSLFQRYGGYDQKFKIYGDWDFFLRVINKGVDLQFIQLCIANYPFDGISSTTLGSDVNRNEIKEIHRRHFSTAYRLKRYLIDYVESILNLRGFKKILCRQLLP